MEPPAVTATTLPMEPEVVAPRGLEAIVNGIDDLATVDTVDTPRAPAAVLATPDAPVTLAAIRQEAMELLAELRALAGRAGQECRAGVGESKRLLPSQKRWKSRWREVLAEPEAAPEPGATAEPEPEPERTNPSPSPSPEPVLRG